MRGICRVYVLFLSSLGRRKARTQTMKPLSATNPVARRKTGGREWKLTLYELIESEREGLQSLRAIGNRYPHDGELQRLIANAALEAAERISKLNELVNYGKDEGYQHDTDSRGT